MGIAGVGLLEAAVGLTLDGNARAALRAGLALGARLPL
jgi:hypothetical protein